MANRGTAQAAAKTAGVLPFAPVASTPTPSSLTAGFFQKSPKVQNQYYEDTAFQRAFALYLPDQNRSSISSDLSNFGTTVLQQNTLNWLADAETHQPRLETWDVWGQRQDQLVTSEGWRNLQGLGISEGIVAIAYENEQLEYTRLHQFLKYHLWTGSCAYVTCPSAMTDGAARLLSRHTINESPSLDKEVFQAAYDHLTSRDLAKAWTSGQWMTERAGGSDVRNTETLAIYSPISKSEALSTGIDGMPLGPWLINGFKWFSSAIDADMAILLAKTPDGEISAFYAPTRRTVPQKIEAEDSSLITTELNGITIHRLKSKLGTRSVPTAELSLTNTRAYLLGTPGQGIKEISTVLNITRIHNAVTACGLWGRGLAISRAFARVRSVRGKMLMEVPAHVRTMANEHVQYRASMLLTYFVAALLGVSEQPLSRPSRSSHSPASPAASLVPDGPAAVLLLRLLTPVLKALTAKSAIAGLAECMESLGGVGYLDSSSPVDIGTNIARLYRDANALSIWEGTTDVMADDTIRVLKGKAGAEVLEVLEKWIDAAFRRWESSSNRMCTDWHITVTECWRRWVTDIRGGKSEVLVLRGREIMEDLGWIVSAVLLVEDAMRDGDEVAGEVVRRWVFKRKGVREAEACGWEDCVEWDRKIVFGGRDKLSARL
ncbi:hypothetical protein N7G274_000440 [Stereocaulon virgatum]|uniref:Acyl-CoA dehydrogenase n=1 Tax=Stereocaulon virgatum TaxID=373712 RepID=A0ABR4ATR8_9LECA